MCIKCINNVVANTISRMDMNPSACMEEYFPKLLDNENDIAYMHVPNSMILSQTDMYDVDLIMAVTSVNILLVQSRLIMIVIILM